MPRHYITAAAWAAFFIVAAGYAVATAATLAVKAQFPGIPL